MADINNYVWVPDTKELFVKGAVAEYYSAEGVHMARVKVEDKVLEMEVSSVSLCNPPSFNKCPDMASLTHLNEPSILYNLYLRYNDNLIYTYSGLFLVAINPYKRIDDLNSEVIDSSVPHIRSLSHTTYSRLLSNNKDQSILVTGESGAGKTENTKKIIQYLLSITPEDTELDGVGLGSDSGSNSGKFENKKLSNGRPSSEYGRSSFRDSGSFEPSTYGSSRLSASRSSHSSFSISSKRSSIYGQHIDSKILQANPILESFGNAKTIKNNNSSRFGKFIRIFFTPEGSISGANVDYYLLEKSRVISQLMEERNYHIFYQFLQGFKNLEKFGLSPNIRDYKYLSDAVQIPSVDDKKDFNFLVQSFNILGLNHSEIENILSVIAVILHLGNLDFTSWKSEQANFTLDSPIGQIVNILGIDKSEFSKNLLSPKVKAGREFVQKSKKALEVKYAIDALAKHLYEKLFQHIINIINVNLKIDSEFDDDYKFIGVLDIAGFEIFEKNSFEQLCINYTNEKLQQFFNHHSFILEQSEYLREDIKWEYIDFGKDLQPTIDLIETRQPMGIFKLLDEECMMPKSSDKTFIEKLGNNWGQGQSDKFKLNKFKSGFIVHHYAGMVEYNVDNWLQKNIDPINEHVLKLLPNSTNPFIVSIIANDEHLQEQLNSKRGSKVKTASLKHKNQLSILMEQLERTEPSFVRCILPNLEKKPNKFDKQLVLNQLRCNGVLEGIRITRAGYPNRMTFEEFQLRYEIINSKEVFTKNAKTNSELILRHMDLEVDSFRVGITKIFFKNGILGTLEEMRDATIKKVFIAFNSIVRGKKARQTFQEEIKRVQAAQVISKTMVSLDHNLKNSPWLELFVRIKPLLEDSLKVLDSKEMSENLKKANSKLTDVEKIKASLEVENSNLRDQMIKLENEIITTTSLIQSKDEDLQKLKTASSTSQGVLVNLRSELANLAKVNEDLLHEKAKAEEESSGISRGLQQNVEELEKSKAEYNAAVLRLKDLESKQSAHQKERDDLETQLVNMRTESDKVKENLAKENKKLMQDLKLLEKKLNETITSHNSHSKELKTQIKSLQDTINANESTIVQKKRDIAVAESELSAKNLKLTELNNRLNLEVLELKQKLDTKAREVIDVQQRCDSALSETNRLKYRLVKIDEKKQQFESLQAKESAHLNEMSDLKKDLTRINRENEIHLNDIRHLKADLEANNSAKADYQDRIITLKNRIIELEGVKTAKDMDKENHTPDESVMEEFANMKLKLNEQSASLRKEKFESRKLTEELTMLKERVANGSVQVFSPRKSEIGSQLGNNKILTEEIEQLKQRLQQEEANSQRAENYAVQLQKKFNQLQSTRGLTSFTDFEKKYKDSQLRVAELESKFEQFIHAETTSDIESLSRSAIARGLLNASQDFTAVYQDISRTLKTTREELNAAKTEILRLKKLLRDSEDELYETKKDSFRTSVSAYEQNLAELSVKYDTLKTRNTDLLEDLKLYKKRASDYYKELEIAESAVSASKRREKEATNELEDVNTQLLLARDESRSTQIMLKQLNIQATALLKLLSDKEHETQLKAAEIKELKDKIAYSDSYENKEVARKHKDEIRDLHKELNFKMESETALVKDNRKLQLDLEETTRLKNNLEVEYNQKVIEEEELQVIVADMKNKISGLETEKVFNERKIGNLNKQVSSLKDLVEEITFQRDKLLDVKSKLEQEIDSISNKLDETTITLKNKESDNGLLRLHLENMQQESESIKSELSESKRGISNDIEDYQKLKREHYVTTDENDSLKKINGELAQKVATLEEKLYSNEQLKFWETKVKTLTTDLDNTHHENYENTKTIKDLERKVKQLEIRIENESQTSKKYNDENFDFQNKVSQYKSVIDILHNESSEKDLILKTTERENLDLKENILHMERELLQLRGRLGMDTA